MLSFFRFIQAVDVLALIAYDGEKGKSEIWKASSYTMDAFRPHSVSAASPFHFPKLPTGANSHISLVGVQPASGLNIIQNIIASATKSIWIEMYLFDNDLVAQMLLKQKAAHRDLDLRLLYHQPDLPSSLDPTNSQRFPAWASPNRGVRTDGQPVSIHHAKFILVDADVAGKAKAYIMTANFTAQALGGNKAGYANREYIVCDTDPDDIALLKAIFLADAAGRPLPAIPDSSNLIVSDLNALALLPLLLRTAKHSLAIQMEYFNDPPGDGALNLKGILLHAAQKGVTVQLMLPPLSPTPPGVPSADNNETYRTLSPTIAVNVTPQYFMHAKMIVADQQLAFVGSQNLSHQSLHYSREVGILISNKSVVSNLLATFNADWKYAQSLASKARR
jgi:phosphatidylserine/phosphatidylglycerophosphate/cardiolipin synthase-like enzyme